MAVPVLARLGGWCCVATAVLLPAAADVIPTGVAQSRGYTPGMTGQPSTFRPAAALALCEQPVARELPERPAVPDEVCLSPASLPRPDGTLLRLAGQPARSSQHGLVDGLEQPVGAQSYYYDGQLQQQPDEPAKEGLALRAGTFLVAYDGLHPKLETFDGSNYQGLMVTFRCQHMRSTPASLLYDIETGEALIHAVAAVVPQPVPTGVLAQPAASQATLGGGLLLFCLLGCRRRSVSALGFAPVDTFNWPMPAVATGDQPAPARVKVSSNIYGQILKKSGWDGTPAEAEAPGGPAKAGGQRRVQEFGQYTVWGTPRTLRSFRVKGNAAVLSHAAHLSLLLMRTSGRI